MKNKRFAVFILLAVFILSMSPCMPVQADDLYDTVLESNNTARGRYLNPDECLEVSVDTDISDMAYSITSSARSNYEKARLIHDWVAENIYYDYDYFNGNKESTALSAKDVFVSKCSVCEGYANLTMVLMHSVRIPCIKVEGYALGVGTKDEWSTSIINTSQTNHTWNEAYVDGRWIVIDTTWDSDNSFENGKFTKWEISSEYFDVSDENMAINHFIVRRESTILESKVLTEGDFKYYVENGGATIFGWKNENPYEYRDLFIPDSLGGYPVLAIADNTFANIWLNDLTLPEKI